MQNVGDIGRQLDDHRNRCVLFAPRCRHLNVFGHLSDGRPHPSFRHAVGAAEVQLEGIGTGILYHGNVFGPGSLVHRQHHRGNQRPIRPIALDLLHFL